MKLAVSAFVKFIFGLLLVGVLLFLPAGGLGYLNGWLFIGLLFLSIPIVLGSWWALLCFLPYLPVIVVRIVNEERLLTAELDGYAEYKARVKYRLIPFVW